MHTVKAIKNVTAYKDNKIKARLHNLNHDLFFYIINYFLTVSTVKRTRNGDM
jgi:hypothetical protein